MLGYGDAVITVAVLGAAGRMGVTVCQAIESAEDLELVAAVDPGRAGARLGEVVLGLGPRSASIVVASEVAALSDPLPDVAVDFTVASSARDNLAWCAEHGVHAVCGTTGLGVDDLARFDEAFGPGKVANAVVAANFSVGAALMMRCAELCAPWFPAVEIVELHHERKKDAPSGTSLTTAERVERAREAHGSGPLMLDPTEKQVLPGTRGGATAAGVHIHSVRLPGLVAHQEVLLGSAGETLTLRHDSTDRVSFMAGTLLAVRKVGELDGLTLGVEPLLGLDA